MKADFLSNKESFSEQASSALEMFLYLATEISILFLVISFLVGVMNQKLPPEKIRSLLSGRKGRGYIMAAGLGAVTPFCSCSTIPMLIGLLKARAGFGPTITFLFTSPLLNPMVIALFIPIFGIYVTLAYAFIALTVSVLAGYLLQQLRFDRFISQDLLEKGASKCSGSTDQSIEQRPYYKAWQEALKLFRSMAPYMLVAMAIGALVHGFLPADFFADSASADNPWAVPTAAVIGIPLYIRVTTLLPLAASLMAKGVSLGAVMALTIGSGGASIPELIMLKRLFQWPMMFAFIAVILFMSIAGGLTFNWLFAESEILFKTS